MSKNCLNCNHLIQPQEKFCANCGQKTKIGKLNIGYLIQEFFSNIFNFEGKIWRTFRDIWIPAKLTRSFIEGKRNNYSNPIRVFIIVLVAFFTIFAFRMKSTVEGARKLSEAHQKELWKKDLNTTFDSLTLLSDLNTDSLLLFKHQLLNIRIDTTSDTLNLNEEGVDLIRIEDQEGELQFMNTIDDDMIKQYGKGIWYQEWALLQLQKIIKDLRSSINFLLGNGIWMVIFVVVLISLLYKLLYRRRSRFYAEHFIFQIYGHSRILLLATIILLLAPFLNSGSWPTLFISWLAIGFIYLFWEMWRYYGQSFFKTFIKLIIAIFGYLFFLTLSFFVVLIISFFLL